MEQLLNISDIKTLFPDEWVLLGNPIMDESAIDVVSGIPLFHSKDKKEVCYIGRTAISHRIFKIEHLWKNNLKFIVFGNFPKNTLCFIAMLKFFNIQKPSKRVVF